MPKKEKEKLVTVYAKQPFGYSVPGEYGPQNIAVAVGDKLETNEPTRIHWAKRDLVQDEPVKTAPKKAAASKS